jgi:uncharacterized membrane protein
MEAMFVLLAILFVAAPIITLIVVSSLKGNMTREFIQLRQQLNNLNDQLKELRSTGVTNVVQEKFGEPVVAEKPIVVEKTEPPAIKESPKPIVVPEKLEQPLPPPLPEPKIELPKPEPIRIPEPVVVAAVVEKKPPEPKRPGFFERNPDLEKFIGENLANKIGIGVLVIGIGFFVKYAIDQEWINEIGRVFIGLSCGGILLGLAHRLRKSFTAFSSVLVGGGIAVLYLTIAIAFHSYHMFPTAVAFLLMVGITSFAVLFSIAYNRVELAVVALLGGFASPFMVSTGEGNYVVLFSYISILNVGMMVLSYYKKWPIINIIAYIFTIILYGSWVSTRFEYKTPGMIPGALVFATGFYLIFFAMNLINNLKERKPFGALEFGLLLSNTFFYYGAGMYVLNNPAGIDYRGLFTVALGVFNFGFAYVLFRNSRVDKNLVYLLIGLVLTFISLAAPIQLQGNYITLFWSAEAVLLLWLSQRSGIKLMKITSFVVMGLMIISLIMDLRQVYAYYTEEMNIVFNKGYLTSLMSVASFVLTLILLKKETSSTSIINLTFYKNFLTFAVVLLTYLMHLFELRHHMYFLFPEDPTSILMVTGAYNMFFILALLLAVNKITSPGGDTRSAFAFWGFIAVIGYLGMYYLPMIDARYDMIMLDRSPTPFNLHYLIVALIIPVCAISITLVKKHTEFNLRTGNAYSWFYVAFFVFLASTELDNIVLILLANKDNMYHVLEQNHKIGFPILWGITSFILIAVGLKFKLRHLRVISLTLFLVTLVKLFAVDIRGISEGGKIAAFISLGVLLLVVSFMYQRLKKILLADDAAAKSQEIKSAE